MQRRTFLSTTAGGMAASALEGAPAGQDTPPETPQSVRLHWLDGAAPALETGLTWGVPWPRGAFRKDQTFALTNAAGAALPLQTWPLAYWPDGSLKWSACATVTAAAATPPLRIARGAPSPSRGARVTIRQTADAIEVDTGKL